MNPATLRATESGGDDARNAGRNADVPGHPGPGRWLLRHHLDHHLFPRVPGYNLARLHARLRPVLLAHGACVFDSYLQVMWRALLAGPSLVDEDVRLVTLERKSP